ncbi:hypothetical protein DRO66_05880, partial [Candidatus Bathyarchaeota archaeon]
GEDFTVDGASVTVTDGDSHDHTGGSGATLDHDDFTNNGGAGSHAASTSHIGASTGVHGVTGDVVGTGAAQTLTAKSLADLGDMNLAAATQLTISSGSITPTQTVHKIGGEGSADDNLATIAGGVEGDLRVFYPVSAAQNITVVQTDNIVTPDDEDYLIPDNGIIITYYDGSNWRIIAFGGSSDLPENLEERIIRNTDRTSELTQIDDNRLLQAKYTPSLMPSYTNTDGSGDRTSTITLTTDFTINDGPFNEIIDGSASIGPFNNDESATGKHITFQFSSQRVITEIRTIMNVGTDPTWRFTIQGSDNGSDWDDLKTDVQILTETNTIDLSTNTTGYE